LYTLLIKPGTITKDYIRGKRIAYTNPFRFLLSLAFLFFLMVTYNNSFSNLDDLGLEDKIEQTGPISYSFNNEKTASDSINAKEQTEKVLTQLDSLKNLENIPIPGIQNLDSLQTLIGQGIKKEAKKEAKKDSFMLADPKTYYKRIKDSTGINSFILEMEFFISIIKHDSINNFDEARTKYDVENTSGNEMAFNSSNSLLKVIQQPGSFINSTISRLPFVIFFFLPLFTVFIWLVYIRKKYTYTDHLIFSFHNQSLLFILLILSLIIDTIFKTSSSGIFLLVFGFYLYKSMRKFYGQGRFKTIVKYIFLNTIFTFLALVVLTILFTGSVFTY
ncbi:MAG: DUF3667 domain-containing protein, partial [Flavobacteriaceae bacterium]